MDRFLKQLETALHVYIVRGDAAIELLESNKWEQASLVLRERKAAFFNYRAADSLTPESTDQFYQSELARKLWKKIELQEGKINDLLTRYKSKYEEQLRKIKKEKTQITKYRSQSQNQNTFVRSI